MRIILSILLFLTITVVYGQDTVVYNSSKLVSTHPSFDFSADSVFQNFREGLLDVEQPDSVLVDINPFQDSTFEKERWLPSTKGQIEAGYQYGLLTGYVDPTSTAPLNVFTTRGDFTADVLQLPFNISYNYSTFKNPLGVNNYFRASLDMQRLNQQVNKRKQETIGEIDEQLGRVANAKDQLNAKLGYGEVLLHRMERELECQKQELENQKKIIEDYENSIPENYTVDTSRVDQFVRDNVSEKLWQDERADSLKKSYRHLNEKYNQTLQLYDSVQRTYKKGKQLYDTYSDIESQLSENKSKVENYSGLISRKNVEERVFAEGENQKEGFLDNIKTLDLGLTYPQTSALSKNNVPIKGVHLELQRKKWYSSVAAGVTMNNLMVSNDLVQNKLFNTKNLFNQFDFQEIRQKGFLVNVVSGYGTKDGNHALLGLRYLSRSKFSYFTSTLTEDVFIPSVGLELDLRITPTFLPKTTLDVVYGKTSDSQKVYNEERSNPIVSLFSSDRTNTSLIKLTQTVNKLRSKFSGSVRWIDPSADMRSLGVLQPNNLRYELQSNHSITSRFRFGLNYRKDRNNVDNRLDTTINLRVVGGQFNGQIGKIINYFGSVNYLTQTTMDLNRPVSNKNNYMYGAGVTLQYKVQEFRNGLTINYNDYLLTDSISTGLFRNIGIQNMTAFQFGQNTFSISYFKSDAFNTNPNTALIIGDELSIQKQRIRLLVGLKIAFSDTFDRDAGAKVELTTRITKFMDFTFKAEKMIMGNFYNAYDRDRFERFPYAFTSNLTFKLN